MLIHMDFSSLFIAMLDLLVDVLESLDSFIMPIIPSSCGLGISNNLLLAFVIICIVNIRT